MINERAASIDKRKYCSLKGKMIIIGSGSIGMGVLPLILRHIDIKPDQMQVITADERGRKEVESLGIKFIVLPLTKDNYRQVLGEKVSAGDFILNLSVDVSTTSLIAFAREVGALYLDTVIEPWAGGYTDPGLSPSQRSNYAQREELLALRSAHTGGPTAIVTHGANPGLVSHFVKVALSDIARDTGLTVAPPSGRVGWAELAQKVGAKVIHIAERDSQLGQKPKKPGEFVNTWSIDGFVSEGCQPAELGWGSHEKSLPPDGREHQAGSKAAIYLMRPGASTRVRTWTPLAGPLYGFLITHGEAISIADYLTVRDKGGGVLYRPTVHYAYHPCDAAVASVHELGGRNWIQQATQRLMVDEVTEGIDELGVLLMGHSRTAYWYGSVLSVDEARRLAPFNNATSLQVCAAVLSGVVWAIENPSRWIVEPEDMDHVRALEIASPYLGQLVGRYGDWTPLQDRERLFPEDIDKSDPWQFKNFRVS